MKSTLDIKTAADICLDVFAINHACFRKGVELLLAVNNFQVEQDEYLMSPRARKLSYNAMTTKKLLADLSGFI